MEKVEINPQPMSQAAFDKNLSPFACVHCGAHSTKQMEIQMRKSHNAWVQGSPFTCDNCGNSISIIESSLTVLPSSVPMLEKDNIKTTTWFHATNIYNWLEEVSFDYGDEDDDMIRPYVHVGSKDAALELGKWKYLEENDNDDDMFYLWEVTLNVEAILADGILEDRDEWLDEVTDTARKALGADAIRYLNKWESSGSISLLVDPRYLTAVRVDEVGIDTFFDFAA